MELWNRWSPNPKSELKGEVENWAVPPLCSRRDAGGHADCLVWGHNWLMLGFETQEGLNLNSYKYKAWPRMTVSWVGRAQGGVCPGREVASLNASTRLPKSAQSTPLATLICPGVDMCPELAWSDWRERFRRLVKRFPCLLVGVSKEAHCPTPHWPSSGNQALDQLQGDRVERLGRIWVPDESFKHWLNWAWSLPCLHC